MPTFDRPPPTPTQAQPALAPTTPESIPTAVLVREYCAMGDAIVVLINLKRLKDAIKEYPELQDILNQIEQARRSGGAWYGNLNESGLRSLHPDAPEAIMARDGDCVVFLGQVYFIQASGGGR